MPRMAKKSLKRSRPGACDNDDVLSNARIDAPPSSIEILSATGPSIQATTSACTHTAISTESSPLSSPEPEACTEETHVSRFDLQKRLWDQRSSQSQSSRGSTSLVPFYQQAKLGIAKGKERQTDEYKRTAFKRQRGAIFENGKGRSIARQSSSGDRMDSMSSSSSSSSEEDDPSRDADYRESSKRRKGEFALSLERMSKQKHGKGGAVSSSSKSTTTRDKSRQSEKRHWLDDVAADTASNATRSQELREYVNTHRHVYESISQSLTNMKSKTTFPTSAKGLNFCPFCKEQYRFQPSLQLERQVQALLDKATKRSSAILLSESMNVCHRHQKEQSLADGKANGWPTRLNHEQLRKRVSTPAMLKLIAARVRNPEDSMWFVEEKSLREKHGAWVDSPTGQMSTMAEGQAGYYGELGAHVIRQALEELTNSEFSKLEFDLRTSKGKSAVEPLSVDQFREKVLFPEIVCALIREDQQKKLKRANFSLLEARRLRDESSIYGNALFPRDADLDDEDDGSDDENEDAINFNFRGYRPAAAVTLDEIIGRDSSPEFYNASGSSTRGNKRSDERERAHTHDDSTPHRQGTAKSYPEPKEISSISPSPSATFSPSRARPRPRASMYFKVSSPSKSMQTSQEDLDNSVEFVDSIPGSLHHAQSSIKTDKHHGVVASSVSPNRRASIAPSISTPTSSPLVRNDESAGKNHQPISVVPLDYNPHLSSDDSFDTTAGDPLQDDVTLTEAVLRPQQ